MKRSEIAKYLGISRDKVTFSIRRLEKQGRLSDPSVGDKKSEIADWCEKVYQAGKDGQGVYDLGLDKMKVAYALEKLEKEGRIRREGRCWVVV